MKTIETINKHFNTLGGLYNISHEKSLSLHDLENEIRSIENYLRKDIPKLLRDILIKYHGYSFNNEVWAVPFFVSKRFIRYIRK